VLFSGEAVDELVKEQQDLIDEAKREDERHRLNLCWKHRQEANHSSFSEHNCHHCQALEHIGDLNNYKTDLQKELYDLRHENDELRNTSVNTDILEENEELRARLRAVTGKNDKEISYELTMEKDNAAQEKSS
jgi:FtsZ-binding cell division protein ZapB